jgi:hypothetical protein
MIRSSCHCVCIAGEISLQQKGYLKDLIVDQVTSIHAIDALAASPYLLILSRYNV